MDIIKAENLVVGYRDKEVVHDMTLALPKGKITVLIGPNGCGKSTVLKTIGRILKPRTGCVILDGKDIAGMDTLDIARKMAILPQTPVAPNGLTVGELVSYGRFPHRKSFARTAEDDRAAVRWALTETHLLELENRPVDSLSGGQRQRAWIAMALAQGTDTILLDEPTTYLDLAFQLEILQLLWKMNRSRKTSIIMVLHDLNLAARHADWMIAVRNGMIIKEGTPEEIMTKDVLRDTFRIDAEIITDERTKKPTLVSYDILKDGPEAQ